MGTANILIMVPQMSSRTLVSYTVCPEAAVVPPPRAHRAQSSPLHRNVSVLSAALTCTLLRRGRELKGGSSKVQELCCLELQAPDKSIAGGHLRPSSEWKQGKIQEKCEKRKRNNFLRPDEWKLCQFLKVFFLELVQLFKKMTCLGAAG